MSNELSEEARVLIQDALAAEAPAGAVRRAELKRALLRRAAMLGAGAIVATGALEAARGAEVAVPVGGAALPGTTSAVTSAGALGALFAKGAAVGLVVVGALHGVARLADERAELAPHAASTPAAVRAPARVTAAFPSKAVASSVTSAGVITPPLPLVAASAAPSALLAPSGSRPVTPPRLDAAASAAPPAVSSPTLRGELELMGAVQAALRDGRPARALELIDRHAALYPRGQLESERLAAETVAACQSGDEARGRQAAERFLRRDASSALAARVRNACPARAPR